MELPKDYEQTQGFTGEYETLEPGGYVCVIKSARVEKTKTDKDMLVIAFDIAEGEEKAGFYQRKFDKDTRAEKKWQGVHRLLVLDNEGKCNKYFKGFTTSVEASNPGYKFTGDETTLKGKKFGGLFGKEEYENVFKERKMTTKLRFIRSANGIKEAKVPEPKLLPQKSDISFETDFIAYNDDLPF